MNKLRKVPLMNEKKRKAFLHDDLCRLPVDVPKAKRQKKSIFGTMSQSLADEHLSPVVEVYSKFRTVDADSESEDVLAVIHGGPPANSPENKNLVVAHKKMIALTPRHQPPKIGTVEVAPTDVLIRTKSKAAFGGQNNHNIIFTKQKKGCYYRKSMVVLKGDTFFNKWPVPGTPIQQMNQITAEQFEKVWPPGLLVFLFLV